MLRTGIVLALFSVIVLAKPVKDVSAAKTFSDLLKDAKAEPRVEYGNANTYIDMVLENVNELLPPTIYLDDLGGDYKLSDCYTVGTTYGLERDGDATLVTTGNEVKFNSQMMMQYVGIDCEWHYLLEKGRVMGTTPKASISSAFLEIIEHDQHPYVTTWLVAYLEDIEIEFNGLPGANWLLEAIAESVAQTYTDEIIYLIEVPMELIVQNGCDEIVLP